MYVNANGLVFQLDLIIEINASHQLIETMLCTTFELFNH